jgi:L-ascorbate metabolism protein UlaG (beta-lactamase superfamily)
MRISHLGHACLLVEARGRRVLIDPGSFSHDWHTIPDLDAVVVTHQHADHVDATHLPALLAGSSRTRLLVEGALHDDPSLLGLTAGDARVEPFAPGDRIELDGDLTLEAVGGQHAVIHDEIPRIGNVGVLVSAEGEPTLFHPGDAYEYAPDAVDVLAVPLAAPWASFKETVAFARAVRPGALVPVHDAVLSPQGRGVYLRQLIALGGAEVRDLSGAGPTEMV